MPLRKVAVPEDVAAPGRRARLGAALGHVTGELVDGRRRDGGPRRPSGRVTARYRPASFLPMEEAAPGRELTAIISATDGVETGAAKAAPSPSQEPDHRMRLPRRGDTPDFQRPPMTASLTGRRSGARGAGSGVGDRSCRSGARRQPRFAPISGRDRDDSRSVSRFLERLRTGPPVVADGGTGALISQAVPGLRCPEEANLRAPESVVAVHASYIAAGAELIETNTFGANRRKLARLLLDESFEEINSAAVRLAREAREVAGRDVFVAGSIGPLGELEVFDASEHGPLYAAQAQVLEGRGVELFMVETFFDLEELAVAVEAVRRVSSLPIVALLTFDDEAEVTGGVGAEVAASRLAALDVAAIGTNHGAGPTVALQALARDARRGSPARRAAEHRPREPCRRPRRLPPLDAGLLRRVRGPGSRPRRDDRRWLLRDDAGPDRGGPRGLRRRPRRARDRRGRRAGARARTCREPGGDRPRSARSARASGSSASSSTPRRAARSTASWRSRARSAASGHVGYVDVNDNPMARATDERVDDLGNPSSARPGSRRSPTSPRATRP